MLITRSKSSNSKKNLIQEEENCPKAEEDIINSKKITINNTNTTNTNTNKEIISLKEGENEHNIDLGIALTKTDNNIPNSRKDRNNITSLTDENNHPKLSTLSENELIKNIIIDTATKIKKNSQNYLNMNSNNNNNDASLGNKSNSIFSPANTLKTENDKNNLSNNTVNYIKNNEKLLNLENGMSILKSNDNKALIENENENENRKGINNDMNPLDMMNQVITTNSNMSNDTQEQLLNTNLNNTNNTNSTNNINTTNLNNTNKFNNTNINRGDSDLLEYSKSCATNQTNYNINSEENTLTNHNNSNSNNNSNNIYNNSTKKNEFQKKISYHCGKYMHKKRINLNHNFNNLNENEIANINEDEVDDNDDKENEDKMNSIRHKNLNVNLNHRNNVLSTIDNSKYNSLLDTNNPKNKSTIESINSNKNNELDFSNTPNNKITKTNNINSNSAIPIPYYNSSNNYNFNMINTNTNSNSNSNSKLNSHYKENTNRTINNGHLIANSLLNTTINDTSSMKKYAKKLTILSELENSKYSNQYNLNNIFNLKTNSIQPIKTGSNMEMLTNENESDIQIGSPVSISNTLSSKLHDWLISCDLLCYYNLLIKNKLYNIEEYIDKIKQNKLLVTYKSIEDLGIRKPGHIFRFLLKLKLDSGLIDPYLFTIISDKYSRNSLNDIRMSSSNNGFGCCCFRNNNCKIDKRGLNSCYGNENYGEGSNDIFCFLRKLELFYLKENFIHNGFDQVEFIILQMFSEFKFNKEVLNEYLHIYNDEDKKKVLKKLYLEKKNICQEYNIEYDADEEKEILTSRSEDNLNDSKPNDSCFIF